MDAPVDFYLASKSPRRSALLKEWGYSFKTIPAVPGIPEVNESPRLNEDPEKYVNRVTTLKASQGWLLAKVLRWEQRPILAADTIVVFKRKLQGKPKSPEEAKEVLQMLSGNTHEVYTSVCGVMDHRGFFLHRLSISSVTFKVLRKKEIEDYVNSGEPMDKAGAYGIQGLAGSFVTNINGSYTGIMGLPMFDTVQLLRKMDIPLRFTQN